jgi:hypothetical protein
MNKRSPFNYVARIERVQKWITANPGLHVNEMLDEMSDTPRGTLSSLLSHMFSAGHLLRPSKGFYTLPELMASPRSVAYDIKKLKKSPNIFRTIKNRTAKPKGVLPELLRNAPEPSNLLQPVITNEQIAQKTLDDYRRTAAIMGAVDVLKSYGVKVTIEF